MKYLVKFFVITASLFFITNSYADTKLAFIDMDKILNESKAGKAATLELNELNKKNLEILQKTGKELSFTVEVNKSVEYRITPMQQILKEYGLDMQIKFVDSTTRWKNLMDRNFTIDFQAWGGLVYPNPETSLKSSLADMKNNNNITGFKSERVDELLPLYDTEFDHNERAKIIQEIDGIYSEEHPAAWGLSREPPVRLLFWNKFGYPDSWILPIPLG